MQPECWSYPTDLWSWDFPRAFACLVESPARLELIDNSHAFLHEGRLLARVPHSAIGFSVESGRGADRRSRHRVWCVCRSRRSHLVPVYEGAVDAELKVSADYRGKRSADLRGGVGVECIRSAVTLRPRRFVRSFPVEPKDNEPLRLANRSRMESVRVTCATAPPLIDGDLGEWPGERVLSAAATSRTATAILLRAVVCTTTRGFILRHTWATRCP